MPPRRRRTIGGPNNRCAGQANRGNTGDQHEATMRRSSNHIRPHKRSINARKYGECAGVHKRAKPPLGENARARIRAGLSARPNPNDPLGVRNGRRARSDSRRRRANSEPPRSRPGARQPPIRRPLQRMDPTPIQIAPRSPSVSSNRGTPSTPRARSVTASRGNTGSFVSERRSTSVARMRSASRPREIARTNSAARSTSRASGSTSRSSGNRNADGISPIRLFQTAEEDAAERRAAEIRAGKRPIDVPGPSRLPGEASTSTVPAGPINRFSPYRRNKRGRTPRNYRKMHAGRSPNQERAFLARPQTRPGHGVGPGINGMMHKERRLKGTPKLTTPDGNANPELYKLAKTRQELMRLNKAYEARLAKKEIRDRQARKRKEKLKNPTRGTRKSDRNK